MAQGLISKKYLIDCAAAIRVKLGTQNQYTPSQMAAAIADITGQISGTINKSSDANVGLITDSVMTGICNALRAKLDDNTLSFTPSQIADAILSIQSSSPSVSIAPWSTGTDAQIAAMLDAAEAGEIDLQEDGGWAVGDVRSISIAAFNDTTSITHPAQTCEIVITSFDDYNNCGCLMQFDFKTGVANGVNDSSNQSSPYSNHQSYKKTIPALVGALPQWLKDRLKTFTVVSAAMNGTTYNVRGNKLALRAASELVSSVPSSASSQEGALIPYYANDSKRAKTAQASYANTWWTRTIYMSQYAGYIGLGHYIDATGKLSTDNMSTIRGLCPFGCLGGIVQS